MQQWFGITEGYELVYLGASDGLPTLPDVTGDDNIAFVFGEEEAKEWMDMLHRYLVMEGIR